MMEEVHEFSVEEMVVRDALVRRIRKSVNRGTAIVPGGVEAGVVISAMLDLIGEMAGQAPSDLVKGQLLGGAIHALQTIEGINYEEVNRTIRILQLADQPAGGRA
jgi:hypothetical protein